MAEFVVINGNKFIIAEPVRDLYKSAMIRDVISSGRHFVVNLNTGEMTIYKPISRVYQLIINTLPIPFQLPTDPEVAMLRIDDCFETYGDKVRAFEIVENKEVIFKTTMKERSEFMRQVKYAMHKA